MGWRDWVRTVEIEPSLYAADFWHLGDQIQYLAHGGARIFHFDVGDGHFIPPVTIGPVVLRSILPTPPSAAALPSAPSAPPAVPARASISTT